MTNTSNVYLWGTKIKNIIDFDIINTHIKLDTFCILLKKLHYVKPLK